MKNSYAFINADIFTADDNNPKGQAMLVEDGYITYVGGVDELPKGDYEIIDLDDHPVIPGLIDSHMHPLMLAKYADQISCLPPQIHSITELVGEIKKRAETADEGDWILGWGYDEGKLKEHRPPNRYDLDKGAEDIPVAITRTCEHIKVINSKALEICGIDRNTPDPQGGKIGRDESGEPDGILYENARNLVVDRIPKLSKDQKARLLIELGELLASQGITSICEMGNLSSEDNHFIYYDSEKKGFKQRVSIYYMWEYYKDKPNFDILEKFTCRTDRIHVQGLKLIGDGSFSGHTAWTDEPFIGTDNCGMSCCDDYTLDTAIEFCKKHRLQLAMHAMGSRAINRIINRVYDEDPWTEEGVPFIRVEHVTEPSEESIKKAANKGIAFTTQPIFLYSEIESYVANLGMKRLQTAYPLKTMMDAGVLISISTDAPATAWAIPSDPFSNIKGAVTRRAYDGTDTGQGERIDVETAIKLYTKVGAIVGGFKDVGVLKAGYKADFAVLDRDIFSIPPDEIDKVNVISTYMEGEQIYGKDIKR